jgi:hypothetical protein
MGMSMFYQEYNFLRTWWKGAALIFLVLMVIYALQSLVQVNAKASVSKTVHVIAIGAALTGLYFTYADFRHDLSHRLLGERFHIGAYLFWMGWVVISAYLLMTRKNIAAEKNNVGMEV